MINTHVAQDENPTSVLTSPSAKKNDACSHSKNRKVKTSVQLKKDISNKKSKKVATKYSSIAKFIKPALIFISADDNSLPVLKLRDEFILSASDEQKIMAPQVGKNSKKKKFKTSCTKREIAHVYALVQFRTLSKVRTPVQFRSAFHQVLMLWLIFHVALWRTSSYCLKRQTPWFSFLHHSSRCCFGKSSRMLVLMMKNKFLLVQASIFF